MAKLKTIYINYDQQQITNDAGSTLAAKPKLAYKTKPQWAVYLRDAANAKLDVSDAVAWRAAVDSDHNPATAEMCVTLNANIDSSAAADGLLIVTLDANTSPFLTATTGSKAGINAEFELWGLDADGEPAYYVIVSILATMPISPVAGTPPDPEDQWADKTYVEARVTAARNLTSPDGTIWVPSIDNDGIVTWTPQTT